MAQPLFRVYVFSVAIIATKERMSATSLAFFLSFTAAETTASECTSRRILVTSGTKNKGKITFVGSDSK